MARRRKASNIFVGKRRSTKAGESVALGVVVVIGIVIAAISMIPIWVWYGVAVLLTVVVIKYIYNAVTKSSQGQPTVDTTMASSVTHPKADNLVSVRSNTSTSDNNEHRLPPPPAGLTGIHWIPMGESVDIAGIHIPGGLLYVGTPPRNTSNPAWIDPAKKVAAAGDYQERQLDYWPSYSEATPTARRAYLNWLASGKCDPDADIGFVFLYFYGLEYRAINDAQESAAAKAEIPQIANELRRLLSIYGNRSGSFRSYAGNLYELLSLADLPSPLYRAPIPDLPQSYEVPLYIRLALGSAAVDGAPVPAALARSWVMYSPVIRLRTPATRCSKQFDQLFGLRYAELFGEGMVLPRNKTKLKCMYRPASMALSNKGITATFGDTPDVTVLTKPIKQLTELTESVTQELDAYSRYLGKNPETESALEGLLLLPPVLWPEASKQTLDELKAKIGDGMLVLSFQELLSTLDARTTLTKDKATAMAKALESLSIGIEPDILSGARLPKPEDKLALFAIPPGEETSRATPAYQVAALTLQVASIVAAADGDFSADELNNLLHHIESWTHLTPSHISRLKAHLRLLVITPASLPALKKKLEPLDVATKETLGAFMATVAQTDGKVTPDEVKMLEKIYKALGIDPKKVFSDVHAVAAGSSPTTIAIETIEKSGFTLDPARIAALQSDTAKVSALLANIFNEDVPVGIGHIDTDLDQANTDDAPVLETHSTQSLMGLDELHTAFARLLISRPQWTRDELQDVATDMDLMLDGALERVNEAAYDSHDIPFTEGDDPIEVNAEVLEKIDA
ncbi:tellurite resistance TerB family protein [Chromobacterium rhizoryzae]|uniref:tellurite resistance TerB family protein n=1 Tax=Chromobacterium rhizoryzae TaxID=1778675 RepID=UPI001D05DFBE|nr:TerB N-terminal domain-containing protein [Chromobacterium rhizoryzae]